MSQKKAKEKKYVEPLTKVAWIALIIGFIAFVFSGGRWNIFITAWIWPFAFLYFSRETKCVRQFMLLAAAIVIGHIIKWLNVLDAGYIIDAVFCIVWAICWILPFVVDRLLHTKFRGTIKTLLFPSVFTSIEILRSFLIVGSFGSTAYTQAGVLPLVQVTSIIGSFGLSFLILWFGSVLVHVAESGFKWKSAKRTVCIYLAVLVAAFGYGSVRLITSPVDNSETVRVATIISPYYSVFSDGEYEALPYEESKEYFVSEVERAAEGGAEIACWSEEAFAIADTDEADFITTAKILSKEYDLYMVLAYETADTDNSDAGLSVNKSVIVEPDGNVTEYIKTKLVPVTESPYYVKGTGNIPTVVTEKTVISSVICFDSDYPCYIHGFGAQTNEHFEDTDILFVPSWDWQSVEKAHTKGAEFRAIENGVSFVKPSYDGISEAVDYQGHVLMSFDTDDTGFDTVQFVNVPVNGVDTVYSKIGTVVDFALIAFGLVMIVVGIISGRRKND